MTFHRDGYPAYVVRGRGAVVQDTEGREYIDYLCGLGALTLGHEPALDGQERGEAALSRELASMIPGVDGARFFAVEADAIEAAVRVARERTGRNGLLVVGDLVTGCAGTSRMPLTAEAHEQPLLDWVEAHHRELAMIWLALPHNRVVSTRFLHALREDAARTACCSRSTRR